MDNKKEQTELKATNTINLFHTKKKKKKVFFFFKKAGRHFGFLKKAGRHQKGAGRRALQKRPRQNTEMAPVEHNHQMAPVVLPPDMASIFVIF